MLTALLTILAVAPLDVAGCKAGTKETGSIHAATSFEVQMEKPKSKLKQPLDCGGAPVTLYLQEFADEKTAGDAANLTGPMLWGENAPTGEHDDELLLKGALMVVVSGPAMPTAAPVLLKAGFKPWRGGDAVDTLERLAKFLDCSPATKDLERAWCPATLTKAAGFAAPKGKGVYLGLSAPFARSKSIGDGLSGTRLSVLAYDGNTFWISDVKPDNEDEVRMNAQAVMGVAMVLKANEKSIAVDKGLKGYLDTLPAKAKDKGVGAKDSAKGPAAFAFKNPARAWKVKYRGLDVYVLSEDVADGQWVSVYPAVPLTAK